MVALAIGACLTEAAVGQNVVYLDEAAMARLRVTNPNHYVRAQKVMDAANELCKPGPAELTFTKADARQVACKRILL
jgi:hypothetical protein